MNNPSFDLIDSPWILARDARGDAHEVSLREIFASSQDYQDLVGELPTQALAMTRMLLAILHRALDGPADADDWADLWEADRLPMERVDGYLAAHRDRFDLLHPRTPFYQVAGLRTQKGDMLPLEKLIGDVPVGDPFFTTRAGSGLERISFAEAARWVVHCQAWDPSGIKSGAVGDDRVKNGKGYPIGTGWCGSLGGLMLEGRNLRETLLLNLVPYDFELLQHEDDDLPAWERPAHGPAGEERLPTGPVDLYTWQSRRIRLFHDGERVHGVLITNGDRIELANQHRFEPMTVFRRSKPQERKNKGSVVYMPRSHDPTRSLWRGLASMLPSVALSKQTNEAAETLPPRVIHWLHELRADHLPTDYVARVRAVGMTYGSQAATTAEVVDDQLDLRVAMLREQAPVLGALAEDGIATADAVANALGNLAGDLAIAGGGSPHGPRDRARESAYAAMDREARRWLRRLGDDTDRESARHDWHGTLRRLVAPLHADLVAATGPTAWTGRTVDDRLYNTAIADTRFRARLNKLLPSTKPPQAGPSTRVEGRT